jgi:hypothetical protein
VSRQRPAASRSTFSLIPSPFPGSISLHSPFPRGTVSPYAWFVFEGFRRREWFGLASLALALAIAATFLDATAQDYMEPRTPVLGTPLGADGQPLPTATPTRPPTEIDAPESGWLIRYVSLPSETLDGQQEVDVLDFDYPTVPFNTMVDDSWRLEAFTRLQLEPGQQQIEMEVDGVLRVYIDGNEVAAANDGDSPRLVTILFEHPGGEAALRIEVEDRGGPLMVRWK